MAHDRQSTFLLAGILAVAATQAPAQVVRSTPVTANVGQGSTSVQAAPGTGGIHHVNPAAPAASGVPLGSTNAATRPASGVRPTNRSNEDRPATTTTQDDGGTPSNAAQPPTAEQPPAH